MRFVRSTQRVVVPAGSVRDVVMARQDRPFNDLTIWGVPAADEIVVGARYIEQPVNVTGVAVTGVAAAVPDGSGTLSFVFAATTLDWQPPGAGGPGRAIDVTLGGTFTLRGRSITQPVTVTGVDILSVTSDAANGAGTLSWNVGTTELTWQAPGAGAPGAAVNVGAGGVFVLAGGDGSSMSVDVTVISLPVGNESDPITLGDDTQAITVVVDAGSLPGADQNDVLAVTTTFPTAQTRNFTSQVFFGPTNQGAPTARITNDEYLIYDPGDAGRVWSANEPSSNPQQGDVRGLPITVRIDNADTVDLAMTIEFMAMTIEQG